ncbi:MAG: ATP-binding cassette domain-containing protein [Dermatophilaceae bacterium]
MAITLNRVRVERPRFAVGPVSTTWKSGSIVGLVGPNGSGKTTLLRGLLGLAGRTTGEVLIDRHTQRAGGAALRRLVSYMPDDPNELVAEMTPVEYWTFLASCRPGSTAERGRWIDHALDLAARLELSALGLRIDGFSHGMRSKTQLVAALMCPTALVVLDEPRNGLDPIALEQLEVLLTGRAAAGATIVVSSHDLEWVDRIADTGHLVLHGDVTPFEVQGGDARARFARAVRAN